MTRGTSSRHALRKTNEWKWDSYAPLSLSLIRFAQCMPGTCTACHYLPLWYLSLCRPSWLENIRGVTVVGDRRRGYVRALGASSGVWYGRWTRFFFRRKSIGSLPRAASFSVLFFYEIDQIKITVSGFFRRRTLRVGSAFSPGLPALYEIVKNTWLVFVNTHFFLQGSKPNLPSIVEIGWLDISPVVKPLPTDIPRKAIWKWEVDDFPNKPVNLLIRKWLPQSAILRKLYSCRNVEIFLTL